jgi:universal stress protein E
MTSFRNLLVGVDVDADAALTPGSLLAAEHALRLARAAGREARVTLLHSSHEEETEAPGAAPEETRVRETIEALRQRFAEAAVDVEVLYASMRPWLAITRRVLHDGHDLVLVGKRNREADDGRPLGVSATKLLRKCPCAVWVVRPGRSAELGTLLAATDLGSIGDRVVRTAAELGALYDAELHVVHALAMPLSVQLEEDAERGADLERMQRAACEEIEKQLEASGRRAELHVGVSSPTRAILDCVERLDPDLLVLGMISRGGIAGLLVGHTAERLLPQLDCSLLALKPPDFVCPVRLED